jgi:hypothetical protein
MAHTPVNHPLRPLYRVLAGLAGLYVLLFGIVGVVETAGTEPFGQPGAYALGLRTNLAFSVISVVAGVVILAATVIGRNIDYRVNQVAGYAFAGMGMLMLALLQTDANVLNFSVATCVVSFVISLVLLTAGLYSKVGSDEDVAQEHAYHSRSA